MNNTKGNTLYFLGIGGIGMSALARYFKAKGHVVAGYDRTSTALTQKMELEGISIHYDDDPTKIPANIDFVIITPAVPADTKELQYLREQNVKIIKRSEALGMISREHKCLAVAGSHGKTTTTALVTHIMMTANKKLSAFIGGIARNIDSNVVIGDRNDEYSVMEADEFDRSFLRLSPYMSIVTSIDADHLDVYGDLQHVIEGFNDFVSLTADDGLVVYHEGLPIKTTKPHITYGFDNADVMAKNLCIKDGLMIFDVESRDGKLNMKELSMPLYGEHNVQNALAAIIVCSKLGVSERTIRESLMSFKGVQWRFEIRVRDEKHVYIDDYGHHPEEIRATLLTARKVFPGKKMTVIFQPHLYSRTRDFMDEFAEVLSVADRLILLDIYPARELPIEGITSEALLEKVNVQDKMVCHLDEVVEKIKALDLDMLITIGAGSIHTLASQIDDILKK